MHPACPVCGATAARRLYRLPRSSIFACEACAQVYLSPLPSEEEIRAMFSQLLHHAIDSGVISRRKFLESFICTAMFAL